MASKFRKFVVGLACLGAALVIYMLYNRLGGTGRIDTGPGAEFTRAVEDFNGQIGTIANVDIVTAQRAEYRTYNQKTKQIEQIFSFEKLLGTEGDQWQLDRPEIDFFRSSFECRVTAETGLVRVEEGPSGPTPKAGKLTGNVVIHIIPTRAGQVKESFVYLDDIEYVGERSLLSTSGPIELVSEDLHLLGTGLELVYDNQQERLEYLRIIDLESLRGNRTKTDSVRAGTETQVASARVDGAQTTSPQPASAPVEPPVEPAVITPAPDAKGSEQEPAVRYKCLFIENVVIDTPKELLVAEDHVSIADILWRDSAEATSGDSGANGPAADETTKKTVSAVAGQPGKTDANIADTPASVAEQSDRGPAPADEQFDMVITCDHGMLFTPMDSDLTPKDFTNLQRERPRTRNKVSTANDDASERTTLAAKEVVYSANTEQTVIGGPLELTFYPNDVVVPGSNETTASTVPVTVAARKQARFLPDSNQAVFTGDCVCTMLRQDPNISQSYRLRAQTLTVDLLGGQQHSADASRDIKHLTATGGTVRLTTEKTTREERLSAVELECRQFDFYSAEQMSLATGPGVIEIDNSNVPEPNSEAGRFSFRRRSWAKVEDFDTLKFFMESDMLIADGESHQVRIGYVPVIDDGQYGSPVEASAGHVEAVLFETPDDNYELATLTATGGVTYEDEDKQFEGDRLYYDAGKSIVTISGDCYFRGAPVDGIKWDITSDRIEFQVTGIGAVQPQEQQN
jgi:hypothetical protein